MTAMRTRRRPGNALFSSAARASEITSVHATTTTTQTTVRPRIGQNASNPTTAAKLSSPTPPLSTPLWLMSRVEFQNIRPTGNRTTVAMSATAGPIHGRALSRSFTAVVRSARVDLRLDVRQDVLSRLVAVKLAEERLERGVRGLPVRVGRRVELRVRQ